MPGAGGSGPKAMVIGAGLAGLAAACRLSAEGWEVEVIERERRVGGRCATVSEEGFLFDTGAQYCRDSYDSALKAAIELALGERFRAPGEPPGVYLDGGVSLFVPRSVNPAGLLPWKALGALGSLGVPRVAIPLISRYRSYSPRFPEWWAGGDRRSAGDFLGGLSSRRFAADFVEPAALFALGAGLSEISTSGMFVALRLLLSDRSVSFTTGIGSLADALASRVRVTTGAAARDVTTRGGAAVGVVYERDGRAVEAAADLVVSAVPAAEALSMCDGLEEALRPVVDGIPLSDAVVVNAGCGQSLDGPAGPVLLPADEGFRSAWLCTSRSKAYEYAPDGSCVLTVLFSGRGAAGLIEEPDEKVLEAALCDAARLYPAARLSPTRYRVDRHRAARPVVAPGYSAAIQRLAREGSGVENLLLAGDWTASPTIEGAVMSGFRAAAKAASTIENLR